ncbi:molybdopterin-containing oxidoreductase family protein [Candidatus Nitrotoga sp. 1052]|uniref:molybdopterin-containing oxidoreductase family protein n=1 Tax=Candidatus Nitrotoga sp. 1052 TaxID=2886964 RepID=UPI001EF3FFF1|nr:molybdopterin-dependent oxidoreductase [Candidatus Nitrotoga sp. 1052]CAH1087845.1 putative menaquinol oxidoreductase complex ACIII, molybdopterin-binding subunit ActB1 [Candidatus Nitrotoga sp. 1052]
MIENSFNRRDFLKVLGWGGATVALSGCGNTSVEDGKEFVTSYVQTADYIIPSIGTYFNSTCAQCDAGCGIMGRVREGRVLKLEGNPKSSINNGKMCGLGQAGVQAHYNPDRIREPLLRNGDKGEAITWEKALGLINEKVGGVKAENVAFLTGGVSGHVKALLKNYLDALGSGHHYVYEAVAPSIMRAANKKAYGIEMPRLRLDKAKVIVSFGADFLGAWISPVHFSQQYARFRKADNGERGVLVQVESKMTLTGANADRWLAIRPGTEGILALGLINSLAAAGLSVPGDVAAAVKDYTADRVSKDTGVSNEHIGKLAALLKERSPSLIIAGSAAEGYAHGSQNATAIALLNQVLGNVGKTVEAPSGVPFPQMAPTPGNRFALQALNDNMAQDKVKVLFSYGANPVFTAPASMKLKENLKKVPFKVVFAHYMDETAVEADLVLPLDSALEDWATAMPEYIAEGAQLSIQQPLMEKLYPGTLGMGDILLALLKQRRPDEYKGYEDFYSYLRSAMVSNKGALGGANEDDDTFWDTALSRGVVKLVGTPVNISSNASAKGLVVPAPFVEDSAYPLHLIPAVSASLRDGRNANEPWLQESPDPLTTIVWDSWVEMHPKTAAKLGIVEGDIVEVASKSGAIKAQVYVFTGIHPDVISVPLGYGHEAMGRYAKGIGVNAFKILDPVFDKETGELAMHETRVKVTKAGQRVIIVKDEGPAGGNQMGRKIAVRMSSSKVNLSEEV